MGSKKRHPFPPPCELCAARATLYCPSDSAFLCPSCDSRVHHANFLVSRHPRQPLCPDCHSVSPCAIRFLPFFPQWEAPRASTSSSSSSCISTNRSSVCHKTTVSSGPKRMAKGADVVLFATWCKRMGLERHAGSIVRGATRVLKACRRGRLRALPLRVAAAASFLWGMRKEERALTWEGMKKVEEVTGVSGKLIMATEAKLRRAAREGGRRGQSGGRMDLREGWAECGPTN